MWLFDLKFLIRVSQVKTPKSCHRTATLLVDGKFQLWDKSSKICNICLPRFAVLSSLSTQLPKTATGQPRFALLATGTAIVLFLTKLWIICVSYLTVVWMVTPGEERRVDIMEALLSENSSGALCLKSSVELLHLIFVEPVESSMQSEIRDQTRGAKRGGAREHCSHKEMDRIDHGRSIWDKSTALVAIVINRVI